VDHNGRILIRRQPHAFLVHIHHQYNCLRVKLFITLVL
jgi:hypothetical protein